VGRRFALIVSLAVSSLGIAAATAQASPGSLGVMFDAGVPDGLTGSVVYRPLRPVNVHAGLGTNLISLGLRAGASVYLMPTAIAPSLSLEIGHYFPGDATAIVGSNSPVLREVGYDYANLHAGLEVGRDRMSFYVHAGFSAIRGKLKNIDELVEEEASDTLTIRVGEDATASVVAPSARIGFLYFF
jgi:hypothetical protein